MKTMTLMLSLFACSQIFAQSGTEHQIEVNAGMFFNNCDYVDTRADVIITGQSARRIFKTMEKAEEINSSNNQSIRKSDSIECSKRAEIYTCYLKVTDQGEVLSQNLLNQQQQQQPAQQQPPRQYTQEEQEQMQRQQQQPQQQQCALVQVIFN